MFAIELPFVIRVSITLFYFIRFFLPPALALLIRNQVTMSSSVFLCMSVVRTSGNKKTVLELLNCCGASIASEQQNKDVTKTRNGEWGMGNGEWEIENGKWEIKMGNGKLIFSH